MIFEAICRPGDLFMGKSNINLDPLALCIGKEQLPASPFNKYYVLPYGDGRRTIAWCYSRQPCSSKKVNFLSSVGVIK